MDFDEYQKAGKDVIDYITNYLKTIRERRVFPDVQPGYIRNLLPNEAPNVGEKWIDIFNDVERVIMPGITHWQSPHMHAYFPALNSFPSLLGEMISEAINCISFTWASSPAATELETLMMDWMVKMLGLPEKFLHSSQEPYGGGVLQTSVSESTYYALLAARTRIFHKYNIGDIDKYEEKSEINGRLVCYCSDQAHSSVEKSALVALTRIKILPTDEKLSLRGDTLREEIKRDKKLGRIPFFICATLGTTGACSFDNLEEIGKICEEEDIWLHIDAAYAGSAFLCPEYRNFQKGIEYATSFVFNASKWLMVNFDCACFWIDNGKSLHQTFTVAPLYLKHKYSGAAIDYMHWQVGLSRRFRALKLWFVIRSFGINGLQEHIRKGVRLAMLFENLVKSDDNFEIPAERHLGLVVFRLKGENEMTEQLLKQLNKDGQLHVVPASIKGKYIIRFTVTSFYTTENDIKRDWGIIKETAIQVLKKLEDKTRYDRFQSSLLLSNVPQTPKFVNASFVAFFPDPDLVFNILKELNTRDYSQSQMPLTPRGKLKLCVNEKQLSFEYSKSIGMNKKKVHFKALLKKQSSLDSKIESIFDEQEHVQNNSNEVESNGFQYYPISYASIINSNSSKDSEDEDYDSKTITQ